MRTKIANQYYICLGENIPTQAFSHVEVDGKGGNYQASQHQLVRHLHMQRGRVMDH